MKLFAAAVLCPWAAGLAFFAVVVRRWNAVKPSFYGTLAGCGGGILTATLITSPRLPAVSSLHQRIWFVFSFVGVVALSGAGLGFWFDRVIPMRIVDFLLVAGSVAAVFSCVVAGAAQHPTGVGIARALAALAFLGSVTATMVLGHWFLVDPKLDKLAISRLGVIFLASLLLEVGSLIVDPGMLNVLRTEVQGLSGYLRTFWVANVILTALLGLGTLGALRNRGYQAVMAATGLSYIAILTAFGVDVIAKALIGGAV